MKQLKISAKEVLEATLNKTKTSTISKAYQWKNIFDELETDHRMILDGIAEEYEE